LTPYTLRGGSWFYYDPVIFRAAFRFGLAPVFRGLNFGFRVILCSQEDLSP